MEYMGRIIGAKWSLWRTPLLPLSRSSRQGALSWQGRSLQLSTTSTSFDLTSQRVRLPLPKSESFEPILENRRLRTFTEEKLAFSLPLYSREQVPLDMVSSQSEHLHILTANPLGIQSFLGLRKFIGAPGDSLSDADVKRLTASGAVERRSLDLQQMLPVGSLDSKPQLCTTRCGSKDILVVFFPSNGLVVTLRDYLAPNKRQSAEDTKKGKEGRRLRKRQPAEEWIDIEAFQM